MILRTVRRGGRSSVLALALAIGALLPTAPGAAGQVPDTASADTVPADTLPDDPPPEEAPPADTLPADTVDAAPDTLDAPPGDPDGRPGIVGDTLPGDTVVADTASADTLAADTLPVESMPRPPPLGPATPEADVWEWERSDLLAARARTLAELLDAIPGVVALRGGDFGMPRAVSAFGAGGGGIRVFRDGVEVLPLEGSVPDLARIGLAGVESVRVERGAAGLRVELSTLQVEDPRAYSLVEAGTGDLDTNLLRGVFFHPRALGGNAGVALDRIDTTGPLRREPGSVTAAWLHYAYLRGDRLGFSFDFHRTSSTRDTVYVPQTSTRTDWSLRGRWEPVDGLVADAFWSGASLDADSAGGEPGRFPFRARGRSQWGGGVSAARGPLSARAAYRNFDGAGLPDAEWEFEAVARDPRFGGLAASWRRPSWPQRSTDLLRARAWSAPLFGWSVFGSVEDFERGVPALAPRVTGEEDEGFLPATPRFSEGEATRLGARFRWRGLDVSGARLRVVRDSVHPLGLPVDFGSGSFTGGERRGWEARARIPLPVLDGLALRGNAHLWDDAAEEPDWPYFPGRSWQGELTFHDTFYPTGNLEVWFDLGMEGRDRMRVPVPADPTPPPDGEDGDLAPSSQVVPIYRNGYVRLQIRVVTVRLFVTWENFTLRDDNQDFPGRVLPTTRSMYGIRWTLWN